MENSQNVPGARCPAPPTDPPRPGPPVDGGTGQPSDAGSQSDSGSTCLEGLACALDDCLDRGPWCLARCFGKTRTSAREPLIEITSCLDWTNERKPFLIAARCTRELAKCAGVQMRAGRGTCRDIYACFQERSCRDLACYLQCTLDASPEGQRQSEELAAMLGCKSMTCYSALRNDSLIDDCLGDEPADAGTPPPPARTCSGVFFCIAGCGDDQACQRSCVSEASAGTQEAYNALKNCAPGVPCREDPFCRIGACRNELARCYEIQEREGPLACDEVFRCESQCLAGARSCQVGCFFRGTLDAQSRYATFFNCVYRNNCWNSDCVETFCATEQSDCFQ